MLFKVFILVAETQAAELLDRPVQALSGGEFQRVLIARALRGDPVPEENRPRRPAATATGPATPALVSVRNRTGDDLIAAQRAYEMNARVISGADQMMQATSQLS